MDVFVINDVWTLSKGTHDGLPLLVRFRQGLDIDSGRRLIPHQLKITWGFEDAVDQGLPSEAEERSLEDFENHLIPELERDSQSALAVVITNNGRRSWYIYTNDVEEFSRRLHAIPQKEDPYPIDIALTRNEAWQFYTDIVKNCS
ncbi:DUF695 domain-containing protein [Cerasicoccus arenae]|uniref:DUF695 domain-containing protein n=1 Tax=Cerasicoccus arenae TaxID=424488 RepID=A0A8J3DKA8_9BACT|nr:DUF695 domain-containing protein [Cerasicoccus arenae]MBK1860101.1 DUF695 domain-containing protein [Cerasicoccus arenae]GHC14411.1 hypothetical protein GCM10007047_34410 [Cerasicoccus arenae]